MIGYNRDLEYQKQVLYSIIKENRILFEIIQKAQTLEISNYYIGAGCICQTVWNYQNNLDLMYGISDVDFVYFDDDTSYESEDSIVRLVQRTFAHLPIEIDVKNQARVHLWYEDHYGYRLQPYESTEAAINTWPTTATAIGVKLMDNQFLVYAPYGLNDMFGQIVRANKTQITKETYTKKCNKWLKKWNSLKIIEW